MKYFLIIGFNLSASSPLFNLVLLVRSHPSMIVSYPKSEGDTYTYPHLDTVAGEALFKSLTSKTNLQFSVIKIISPLAKVKILLSSRTVLRFSIQIASTGPSQTIHVLCLLDL